MKETTKKRIIADVRVREPNTKKDERNFQRITALHCTADRKRQQAEQSDLKVKDYHPRNPFCH